MKKNDWIYGRENSSLRVNKLNFNQNPNYAFNIILHPRIQGKKNLTWIMPLNEYGKIVSCPISVNNHICELGQLCGFVGKKYL